VIGVVAVITILVKGEQIQLFVRFIRSFRHKKLSHLAENANAERVPYGHGQNPAAEPDAVAVNFKRRHRGAVKWWCFTAKSRSFCERGLPVAANGLAVSETKAASL
jgi:hypothetical protein